MTGRQHLPDSGDYDAADDLSRSVEYAYEAIRERVAHGGRGWRGWPAPMSAAADLPEAGHE
jgi:hypothetical protein